MLPSCADLSSSMCPFCEWLRERGWGRERGREEEKREKKGQVEEERRGEREGQAMRGLVEAQRGVWPQGHI